MEKDLSAPKHGRLAVKVMTCRMLGKPSWSGELEGLLLLTARMVRNPTGCVA